MAGIKTRCPPLCLSPDRKKAWTRLALLNPSSGTCFIHCPGHQRKTDCQNKQQHNCYYLLNQRHSLGFSRTIARTHTHTHILQPTYYVTNELNRFININVDFMKTFKSCFTYKTYTHTSVYGLNTFHETFFIFFIFFLMKSM